VGGAYLEPHDLVLAKIVRGDERDCNYARAALGSGLVELKVLLNLVEQLPTPAANRAHIRKSRKE
jgi:hypothetical protein